MHVAWIQAAMYQPPVVLGRQLYPLSAFHSLVLDAVKSPFVVGGRCDMQDLVLAVHVCSLTWDRRVEVFGDKSELEQWGRTAGKGLDWGKELTEFKLYLDESRVFPPTWDTGKNNSAKASGAYHMAVFAMQRLGMCEADAWDCPVARLMCYSEASHEQETGKSDLVGDDIEAAKAAEGVE